MKYLLIKNAFFYRTKMEKTRKLWDSRNFGGGEIPSYEVLLYIYLKEVLECNLVNYNA